MAESSPKGQNRVGKGEIARLVQCLFFPQCFQKTCTADMYKQGLVWKMVNSLRVKTLCVSVIRFCTCLFILIIYV